MNTALISFPEIYQKLELPRKEVSLSQIQAEFIYFLLEKSGIKKTLEIGFSYGCSAAYILSATQSIHYVIDPHQEYLWKNKGVENIQKLGLKDLLVLEEDYSHNVLPKLLKELQQFEFIFIDGDHKYDVIMVDFYYADLLLNVGGYILFDDTWMRSTQTVIDWIATNRNDYERVDLPDDIEGIKFEDNYSNLALFQKTNYIERPWDHFNEFCNQGAFNEH